MCIYTTLNVNSQFLYIYFTKYKIYLSQNVTKYKLYKACFKIFAEQVTRFS